MPGTNQALRRARSGSVYRRTRAEVLAKRSTCVICGERVPRLVDVPRCEHRHHRRDTGCPTHPTAPSLEHPVALNQGGSKDVRRNGAPAHYGCNSSRGDGTKRSRTVLRTSVAW